MRVASRVLTVIEDRLLTAPNPFFSPAFCHTEERSVDDASARIREIGGIDAGVLMPVATCAAICANLDLAYAGNLTGVRTRTNSRTGIAQVLNPLRVHPALLQLATQPFVLAVIESYLRRRIYLADVDVRRVPPMTMDEVDQRAGTMALGYTSSHWHRDIRGRQVKVMVYLTEVAEGDSNFAYLPGSHRGYQHRPQNIERSRFTDAQVASLGIVPVECYGPAGTTLVFDTNCIHRLRRKSTARLRDTVTFYYTPGQELRALDVEPEALRRLPELSRALFGGKRHGAD
jgi:ectoine hydroxylase-related dioxygenase (phytanoyl-CoA dioxygenase family)